MRRIVLPQAMRVIIPPTGNETISMLKTTSLVGVIASLGAAAQRRRPSTARNFQIIPLLIVASIWYLVHDQRADARAVPHRAALRARVAAQAAADAGQRLRRT